MNRKEPDRRIGGIRSFLQNFRAGRIKDRDLLLLIERMIDIADPTIRRAGRYRLPLSDPVAIGRDYCFSLIDQVPGPVELTRHAYFNDPTVKALFATPEQFNDLIRLSPDVESLQKTGYDGEAVALLTMSRVEKTVFGHQRHGELLLRDVQQRTVNFTDHRLIAPADSLTVTQGGIVERGMEVLATVAMERITNLRARILELRQQRDYLNGAIHILDGKAHMYSRFTAPDSAMAQKLLDARERLKMVEEELEETKMSLTYPEDSLKHLSEVMRAASDILIIDTHKFKVNWMNVLVGEGQDKEGHEITLARFSLGGELERYGIFVQFPIKG